MQLAVLVRAAQSFVHGALLDGLRRSDSMSRSQRWRKQCTLLRGKSQQYFNSAAYVYNNGRRAM